MFIVTQKPADTSFLPAELREILDMLAAYGRKARLSADASGRQQSDYQKAITEANAFLDGIDKSQETKPNINLG